MWDLIVSVPDHCLSFYFEQRKIKISALHESGSTVILKPQNEFCYQLQYGFLTNTVCINHRSLNSILLTPYPITLLLLFQAFCWIFGRLLNSFQNRYRLFSRQTSEGFRFKNASNERIEDLLVFLLTPEELNRTGQWATIHVFHRFSLSVNRYEGNCIII